MKEFIRVIINKQCVSVIIGLTLVLVILINSARADSGVTWLGWYYTTALPENLVSHALVISGNYIYCIGGANVGEQPVNNVYYAVIYSNGELGYWNTTAALPQGLVGHTALASDDGKIYVIGGWNGSSVSANVYRAVPRFDGSIEGWVGQAPLPDGRSYHATVLGMGNVIYVIGGWSGFTASAEVYSAVLDDMENIIAWEGRAPLPKALYRHAAVVGGNYVVDEYIYVLGGRDISDASDKVYRAFTGFSYLSYWEEMTSLLQPVYYHTTAIFDITEFDYELYLMGGWRRATSTASGWLIVSPDHGGTWFFSSYLPLPICRHASATTDDGVVYIAGGTSNGTDYLNNVFYTTLLSSPTPTNTPTVTPTPMPTETPTSCPPPNTPGAVQAVVHSVSRVQVTWEDTNPGSDGCANVDYWVYRDWNSNATPYPTPIATVQEGRNLSYSDSGLSCGTRYMYGVHAYRASDGQLSGRYPLPSATVTTYICPPSCLQARQISRNEIQLLWKDKSTTESRYEIHRNQMPGATPSPIATLAPNTESYVDNNVTCALTYTYFVYAVKTENDRSERHKSVEMPPCEEEIAVQVTSNITSSTVVSGTVLTYTITYTNSGYNPVVLPFFVSNERSRHAVLLDHTSAHSPITSAERTIKWTITDLAYPDGTGQVTCSVKIVTDALDVGQVTTSVQNIAASEYKIDDSQWRMRQDVLTKYINPYQIYMPLIFKSGCE